MSLAPPPDAPNVTEQAIDSRPLLALVLLAAVMLVYLPGLEGRFTFDDYPTIVDNPALDLSAVDLSALLDAAFSGAGTGPLARPLALLSFAAQRTLGGLDPWPSNSPISLSTRSTRCWCGLCCCDFCRHSRHARRVNWRG